VTDTARDVLGVAILIAIFTCCTTCLVFPGKIQGIAISYYDWLLRGKMPWFMQRVRSERNVRDIRLVGAIGSVICCFVLWLIVKNSLHL
jgi:hypothetical protein